MFEITTTTNPESLSQNSSERLKHRLDDLSSTIPEIAETREVIEDGSKSLIEDFGLKPEFFDDEAHSLYFVALAQRNGNLIRKIESGQDPEAIAREKEFIYDAMELISLEKSSKYDQFANLVDSGEKTTGEYDQAVYEKFTNQEVTGKIKSLVENGLLAQVQSRLGITQENEDHYEIRVLNVGNTYAYSGMLPKEQDDDLEQPNYSSISSSYDKEYEAYVDYKNNLIKSSQDFMAESKMGGEDVHVAWRQEINGVNTLVLPLPVAEMLLDPEGKIKGDKDKILERMVSLIEHEYVHTQSSLYLDSESLIGISLEELRAEHYSGNKQQGYDECKSAATYLIVATGFDLTGEMDKLEKGGNCAAIFTEISKSLGLQQAFELNLSFPSNYVDGSSQLITRIDGYLGGLNGFIKRLCENDRFKDRSEQRFEEYAGIKKAKGQTDVMIDYYNYDATINRMPYAASKMIQKLETQRS